MRATLGFVLLLCACSGSVDSRSPEQDFDHGSLPPAASGGSGGGDAGLPPLIDEPYPDGPYGSGIGATIENLTLLGWSKPAEAKYDPNKLEKLDFADYYNPNGDKPYKLVWLSSHAVWCGVCNAMFTQMRDEGTAGKLHMKGVEIFATLFEDGKNPPNPATPENLSAWGMKYQATYPLAVDPGLVLGAYYEVDAIPANVIVETKSMKIVASVVGGDLAKILATIDDALKNLPQ